MMCPHVVNIAAVHVVVWCTRRCHTVKIVALYVCKWLYGWCIQCITRRGCGGTEYTPVGCNAEEDVLCYPDDLYPNMWVWLILLTLLRASLLHLVLFRYGWSQGYHSPWIWTLATLAWLQQVFFNSWFLLGIIFFLNVNLQVMAWVPGWSRCLLCKCVC